MKEHVMLDSKMVPRNLKRQWLEFDVLPAVISWKERAR